MANYTVLVDVFDGKEEILGSFSDEELKDINDNINLEDVVFKDNSDKDNSDKDDDSDEYISDENIFSKVWLKNRNPHRRELRFPFSYSYRSV